MLTSSRRACRMLCEDGPWQMHDGALLIDSFPLHSLFGGDTAERVHTEKLQKFHVSRMVVAGLQSRDVQSCGVWQNRHCSLQMSSWYAVLCEL